MFVFIHIAQHFNPRSREGSDVNLPINVTLFIYFNPRSREGSDIIGLDYVPFPIGISIHAPARGATVIPPLYAKGGYYISIHAPARGATVKF